jgi:hypothetical protein
MDVNASHADLIWGPIAYRPRSFYMGRRDDLWFSMYRFAPAIAGKVQLGSLKVSESHWRMVIET